MIASLVAPVAAALDPPAAPVRPVTDRHFGTDVIDNYRSLENLGEPEVRGWMQAHALWQLGDAGFQSAP